MEHLTWTDGDGTGSTYPPKCLIAVDIVGHVVGRFVGVFWIQSASIMRLVGSIQSRRVIGIECAIVSRRKVLFTVCHCLIEVGEVRKGSRD